MGKLAFAMETYDVIVNQPVVIDNVSSENLLKFMFCLFDAIVVRNLVVRKRRNAMKLLIDT